MKYKLGTLLYAKEETSVCTPKMLERYDAIAYRHEYFIPIYSYAIYISDETIMAPSRFNTRPRKLIRLIGSGWCGVSWSDSWRRG